MTSTFPFMTSYDPPGTSEGTLDPLGLYQIADQLAVQLVPAVRERMQRIRFLSAMAVGSLVTDGLQANPEYSDASPYLVWEWLVTEALMRTRARDPGILGTPGTSVTRRAINQFGYLDARSYLKTPRIFGFNGVYKRLANRLGIVDVHLGAGPNTEAVADAWARSVKLSGINEARPLFSKWSDAVKRGLGSMPPSTKKSYWNQADWSELAVAFGPDRGGRREKRYLRDLILAEGDKGLGALSSIWRLISEVKGAEVEEETLHQRLEEREPNYAPLINAIRAYEAFARSLQDAFDVLRFQASSSNSVGYSVPLIAKNADFRECVDGLDRRFETAHMALGEINIISRSVQALFDKRFHTFAEPMDAGATAIVLCEHHKAVQQSKSADGKRAWFDQLGQNQIYLRTAYRIAKKEIKPGRYVHDYRVNPINRFYRDLS